MYKTRNQPSQTVQCVKGTGNALVLMKDSDECLDVQIRKKKPPLYNGMTQCQRSRPLKARPYLPFECLKICKELVKQVQML